MEVARRTEAGTSGLRRSRLDDGGFIMVALLIAMAVSAIWLATMLPAWRQQAVRQREGDLIFRGQQYARAIALYYVNDGCTLPLDVDVLVSRHFLRKKWKDPIANDDFVPLVAGGTPTGTSGAPGTSGTPSTQGGRPGAPPSGGRPGGPGSPIPGGQQLVGLYGVSSKSTDTSIMVYQNQQQYNLWSFRYTDALLKMGRPLNCANGNQPGAGNGRGNGLPSDGRGGPGGPTNPGGRPGPGDCPLPGFVGCNDGAGSGRGGRPTGPPPPGIGGGRGGPGGAGS